MKLSKNILLYTVIYGVLGAGCYAATGKETATQSKQEAKQAKKAAKLEAKKKKADERARKREENKKKKEAKKAAKLAAKQAKKNSVTSSSKLKNAQDSGGLGGQSHDDSTIHSDVGLLGAEHENQAESFMTDEDVFNEHLTSATQKSLKSKKAFGKSGRKDAHVSGAEPHEMSLIGNPLSVASLTPKQQKQAAKDQKLLLKAQKKAERELKKVCELVSKIDKKWGLSGVAASPAIKDSDPADMEIQKELDRLSEEMAVSQDADHHGDEMSYQAEGQESETSKSDEQLAGEWLASDVHAEASPPKEESRRRRFAGRASKIRALKPHWRARRSIGSKRANASQNGHDIAVGDGHTSPHLSEKTHDHSSAGHGGSPGRNGNDVVDHCGGFSSENSGAEADSVNKELMEARRYLHEMLKVSAGVFRDGIKCDSIDLSASQKYCVRKSMVKMYALCVEKGVDSEELKRSKRELHKQINEVCDKLRARFLDASIDKDTLSQYLIALINRIPGVLYLQNDSYETVIGAALDAGLELFFKAIFRWDLSVLQAPYVYNDSGKKHRSTVWYVLPQKMPRVFEAYSRHLDVIYDKISADAKSIAALANELEHMPTVLYVPAPASVRDRALQSKWPLLAACAKKNYRLVLEICRAAIRDGSLGNEETGAILQDRYKVRLERLVLYVFHHLSDVDAAQFLLKAIHNYGAFDGDFNALMFSIDSGLWSIAVKILEKDPHAAQECSTRGETAMSLWNAKVHNRLNPRETQAFHALDEKLKILGAPRARW